MKIHKAFHNMFILIFLSRDVSEHSFLFLFLIMVKKMFCKMILLNSFYFLLHYEHGFRAAAFFFI